MASWDFFGLVQSLFFWREKQFQVSVKFLTSSNTHPMISTSVTGSPSAAKVSLGELNFFLYTFWIILLGSYDTLWYPYPKDMVPCLIVGEEFYNISIVGLEYKCKLYNTKQKLKCTSAFVQFLIVMYK